MTGLIYQAIQLFVGLIYYVTIYSVDLSLILSVIGLSAFALINIGSFIMIVVGVLAKKDE